MWPVSIFKTSFSLFKAWWYFPLFFFYFGSVLVFFCCSALRSNCVCEKLQNITLYYAVLIQNLHSFYSNLKFEYCTWSAVQALPVYCGSCVCIVRLYCGFYTHNERITWKPLLLFWENILNETVSKFLEILVYKHFIAISHVKLSIVSENENGQN